MGKINRLSRIPFHSLLLGLLLSTTTLATTDSDSVRIIGFVQEVMTVTVTGGNPVFNIIPEVPVSNQNIGTININSNDPDGYKVTLSSNNEGRLVSSKMPDQTIPYTVKYDNSDDIELSTAGVVMEIVNNAATAGQVVRTLTLNINGADSKGSVSDSFSDVISVEIAGM
jgi:hypothetical protein